MAKAATIKIKLVSTADTGYFYTAKKNSRTMTDKLTKKKYDPVARKHVEFKEAKIDKDDDARSDDPRHLQETDRQGAGGASPEETDRDSEQREIAGVADDDVERAGR